MAAVFGQLAGAIFPQIIQTGFGAIQSNKSDQEFRNSWTQSTLSQVSSQNSGRNIMIVYPNHTQNFVNSQQSTLPCQCPSGNTITYTCYVFDSGDFELKGDGGYLNWAFTGNFKRNGSKVTFSK
ncbi:hypothetical protein KC354_g5235 [Hortaea werneckii]|nr:hypothetical protein KC354_g5235 [Hortaea werneckii]